MRSRLFRFLVLVSLACGSSAAVSAQSPVRPVRSRPDLPASSDANSAATSAKSTSAASFTATKFKTIDDELGFEFSESDRIASGADFSAGGDQVAMIRVDGRLLLFRNTSERKWEQLPSRQAHVGRGTDVTFLAGEIATIGTEGKVQFWQVGKDEPVKTISLGGEIRDARFLNNRVVAVVRGETPQLELHLIDTKRNVSRPAAILPFDADFQSPAGDRLNERLLNRVAMSHNNRVLAACSSVEGATEVAFYDVARLRQPPALRTANPPSELRFRNWTSADGKYQVEAALLEVKGGVARLKRKSDGVVVEVPLGNLKKADRDYINEVGP